MILNFYNIKDHIVSDSLVGIPIQRVAIFDAGLEQRSVNNVSSYDKDAGRINFSMDLSNHPTIPTIVIISTI